MKQLSIILLSIVLTILSGCASTTNNTPLVEYQEIIEFDKDIDKSILFDRTRLWLAEAFVDSEEVIELADKETGVIVGNGGMKYTFPLIAPMPGRFSLRIDVKDGRLRTTYSNFKIYFSGSQYSSGGWTDIREGTQSGYPEQSITAAKKLNDDLKNFIKQIDADSSW
ncbi:DUF4468 domain-containing protein [Pseudidiomarina marina]|uniref:DUF4468 domain-containing protein n=1 Tax=Pseudidiomarina marina TaxID=502366 RepID=UPI00384D1AB2